MATTNLAEKTPSPKADTRPAQQRGLRVGNKGNKGGGRPPKGYQTWLQAQLDSLEHRQAFERAIKDDLHDNFAFATRHATEHTVGKPAQKVELTGKDGAPFTVRLVRE